MNCHKKKRLIVAAAMLTVASANAFDKSQGLPLPEIPDSLQSREQKVEYAATHFWDDMDFANSELAEDEAFMEQSMVNYLFFLDFLQKNGIDTAAPSIHTLLASCREYPKSYTLIRKIAAKYLYDFSSPMRNEDLYDAFIDEQLCDSTLSKIDRIRLEEQRTLMNLNRPGSLLNDFAFILSDGTKQDFSAYRDKDSYALLIFYDPDCDECIETIRELSQNPELENEVANARWQVFAIARYGTLDSWHQLLAQLPQQWVNGYDCDDVEGLGTYDLPAAPTVLSVNPEGKVVEKYDRALKEWLK